eukprot:scaffold24029_cov144-Skeletonema_dohrnii-CCMP3373.AAC.7
MANADGVVQLKAPAETGEREMNSKRKATAEEEEVAVVEAAMIEKEKNTSRGLQTRTLPSTEAKWNNFEFKGGRSGNGVGVAWAAHFVDDVTIRPCKDSYLRTY